MKELLGYVSENKKLSIRAQCELLEVNRSSVYYKAAPESEENLAIRRLKKYSVNDYIQMLTDLKKIKINDQWYFNEITRNSSRMLEKLGLSYE